MRKYASPYASLTMFAIVPGSDRSLANNADVPTVTFTALSAGGTLVVLHIPRGDPFSQHHK